MEFVHSRYKIIGNTYRYFFGIRNSGLANYTEPVTLSLYNKDKVIFTQTYTFASTPIRASGVKCPPIVYTDLSGLFCKVTAPVLSTAHHDIPATGGALPPVVKW